MTAPFERVVAMLDNVRKATPRVDKGIVRAVTATCPACGKRKLGVAETSDGAVVVNCFPCGGSLAPMNALGLDYSELYPPRTSSSHSIGGPSAWVSCASLADAVVDKALALAVEHGDDALRLALLALCDAAEAMRKAAREAMRNEYRRAGK